MAVLGETQFTPITSAVGDTTLNRLAGYRIVNGRPDFTTGLEVPP